MFTNFWRISNSGFQKPVDIIAETVAIGFIIIARLFGGFEFLELYVFDTFMRIRPQENPDERILIVGINEDDIRNIGQYPIPDGKLALLLQELQNSQPVAIGLDIYRDLAVPPGSKELANTFKQAKNLIGVETIVPDISKRKVNPPPTLLSEQLGFADAVPDKDGKQRRALLGASNANDEWRLSLPLQLARIYLEKQGIKLDSIDGDEYGMRFGVTELPRFRSNSGGYIKADAGGSQTLINFRAHPQPFAIVSLKDVVNKKVLPEKIRNKIVLVGIMSPSAKDYVVSEAIKLKNYSKDPLIYGVEVQAHVVSQIISAVEDRRTLLKTWSDGGEYLWIVFVGFAGIFLGRSINSSRKLVLTIGIISLILVGISYQLLIFGWWLPIVPSILVFLCNGLAIAVFSKYDEALRTRIQDRQIVIDSVFETIHGGPLQKLSMILRNLDGDEKLDKQILSTDLRQLNQELRQVHILLQRETSTNGEIFYLRGEQQLNLQQPIHEVLHQVYFDVLERNHPEFKTLKIKIVNFQRLDERNLSIEQKRGLCRFLEEGLTNAGKYARGMTRLDIICKQEQGFNVIRVSDNGCGIQESNREHQGFGTKQAQNLAKQLRGKFQRFANSPKGAVYQLIWTARKFNFWRL
ncbi:histidine kinase [Scytonema hofmannii PCC 7110]|uniref:Histidine kinase n=1 Tax=Scytonema hofmannii PCC 7110 TaxID=128403 RepID=A0A139WZ65_9CYAN|nr:CHASE2 domain-containing protein [Scytonema hofmannii]KYC37710.1 histidine kinase [Scytonema hofmannii PCC 7110]